MGDNLFGGIETKGRYMTYTNMEGNRRSGSTQTEFDRLDVDDVFANGGDASPLTIPTFAVVTQNPRSTGQAYRLGKTSGLPTTAGVPHFSIPFVASRRAGATAVTAGAIGDPITFSFQVPLVWSIKRDGAGTSTTWKVLTGRGDICTAKSSTTDNAVTFPVDIDDAKQSDYLSDSTGLLAITTAASAVGGCQTFALVSRVLMHDQPS